MNKITEINRNSAHIIRMELDKKLAELSADLGVNLTLGMITMSRDGLTFSSKIEGVVASAGVNSAKDLEAQETFKMMSNIYGISPSALGATFVHGGKAYTIKGMKMGRSKVNLLVETKDGKEYLYNVTSELQRMSMNHLHWSGLAEGESFYQKKAA